MKSLRKLKKSHTGSESGERKAGGKHKNKGIWVQT